MKIDFESEANRVEYLGMEGHGAEGMSAHALPRSAGEEESVRLAADINIPLILGAPAATTRPRPSQ